MSRVWQGRVVLALAAVLTPALTGCNGFFVPETNGSGSGSTSGDYVYVANANPSEAEIAAYSVSSSGTLTAVTGSPFALSFIPTAMAVTPNDGYLYVGGTVGLYAYTISSGALTLVGNAGASVPVESIAITPDGEYLFALQSNVVEATTTAPTQYSVTLDEYEIDTGGALSLVADPSFTTTSGTFSPKMVQVSPNGDFVAVALGSAGTAVVQLSSDLPTSTVNTLAESNLSADNALTFDTNSAHLYIARSGVSTGLAEYTVSSTGGLAEVGSGPAATDSQPSAVALMDSSAYVYVASYASNALSGFVVESSGTLQGIADSPFSLGTEPVAMAVDNTGDYLLIVNSGGSPDVDVYSINTNTGELSLTGSTSTGTDPTLPVAIAATH